MVGRPTGWPSISAIAVSAADTKRIMTQARASSPEPSARLIADDTPPPIAPEDIICVNMMVGKTSAMAASASLPSHPM